MTNDDIISSLADELDLDLISELFAEQDNDETEIPRHNEDSGFLSFQQQRLWLQQQVEPNSSAYNVPRAYYIETELDLNKLQNALNTLVNTHQSICTRFSNDNKPKQIIVDDAKVPLVSLELSDDEQMWLPSELLKLNTVQNWLAQPFNLNQAPLFRAAWAPYQKGGILLLNNHHIASDGWSANIILRDLARAYLGESIVTSKLRYLDYAQWQRAQLDGELGQSAIPYWTKYIDFEPQNWNLPEKDTKNDDSYAILAEAHLTETQTSTLRRLCKYEKITLASMCMALYQSTIARFSDTQEFLVGVPTAARNHPEIADIVGFFVNTQLYKNEANFAISMIEVAKNIQSHTLAVLAHQLVPYEWLAQELGWSHNNNKAYFQVMYNFTEYQAMNNGPMPLPLTPIFVDEFEAKFALSLEVLEQENSIQIRFEGAPNKFDEQTLKALLSSYLDLLEQVLLRPESYLGNITLKTNQLLIDYDYEPLENSFLNLINKNCDVLGQQTAIKSIESQVNVLTYQKLGERSTQIACYLRAQGIQTEQKVVLFFERGIDMLVSILGVLKAGATYVPIDPKLPQSRIDYIFEHSGAEHVLHNTPLNVATHIKCFDVANIEHEPNDDLVSDIKIYSSQLAYTIYTSGSTGKPKGVAVTHGNLTNFLLSMQNTFRTDGNSKILALTSLSFDISGLELLLPIISGGQVVIAQEQADFNVDDLIDISMIQATPSGWRNLLAQNLIQHPVIGLCGGEALQIELVEELQQQKVSLWNMYGPTETTIWSSCYQVDNTHIHLGVPIKATQFYVLDEALNLCPNEVSGELYIAGFGLARGYLNRPDLSAERFIANPFSEKGDRLYRTGDLVVYNREGELEYIGRTDHQVKIRGFRIELGEVESHLYSLPNVKEAVVITENLPTGARLVAYVVGPFLEPLKLQELLTATLPHYMVPSVITVLDTLPLNNSGKIDRHALPKANQELINEYEAPLGLLETNLEVQWKLVLRREQISRNDDFFTLGGDSIVALQLASRISDELLIHCSVKQIFTSPSIAKLAKQLNSEKRLPRPKLVSIENASNYALAPAQTSLWLSEQMTHDVDKHSFNISGSVWLNGSLNVDALERAFTLVIARHKSLRTRFVETLGEASIEIVDQPEFNLVFKNLSDLSEQDFSISSQQLQKSFEEQPFELEQALQLRAMLLKKSNSSYQLTISMHHIISDAWSVGVLIDDLGKAYQGVLMHQPPAWSELTFDYLDYANWQHSLQSGEHGQLLRDYWRQHLNDAPLNSALPTHFPRPKRLSNEGKIAQGSFSVEQTKSIKAFAIQQKVSVNALLLSGYFIFLHALHDKNDVVLGTDFAGRDNPALESLIGFFVRVLPQRSQLEDDMSTFDFIKKTQDVLLSVIDNHAMGLESLTELIDAPRVANIQPLVQQLFVMQNIPKQEWPVDQLDIESIDSLSAISSKFDSALFVIEGEELQCQWVYRKQLYNPEIMEQWLNHWRQCVLQLISMSEQPVRNLVSPMTQEFKTMQKTARGNSFSGLKKGLKKRDKTPVSLTKTSFLPDTEQFPIFVEPTSLDLDPISWASNNRDVIDNYLKQYGGIIFRNFALQSPQEFEMFADAIQPGLYGQYGDLPKKEGGKNTYKSTPYPERQMILYHNESSHLGKWPRKQWFFCEQPSPIGGATPIVDCRRMLKELPQSLVAKIKEKELLYVRNFIPNLDVNWQDFYKTENKIEVEEKLNASNTEFRWLDNGGLQTRTKTHGVISHHLTGEESFFNQVQLHHESCLDEDVRDDLIDMVGHEYLPRNVFFGDGSPISYEDMELIGQAYERCAVRFDWQKGDVVMLDNMLAAHARDPFEGPRKIVVAMGDMVTHKELKDVTVLDTQGLLI